MPWPTDRESKRRSDATYSSPEYVRNRAAVRRQADGRCAECGHRHARLQCDHVIPVSQGGTHAVANLRMTCTGPGTCRCHERKTATEGGGYRNPKPADPDPRPGTVW